MLNGELRQLNINIPVLVYFLSTFFMVFFSVHAIHQWPNLWAQGAISLACILPAFLVFVKKGPTLIRHKKWPPETKFIFFIVVLGLLNICLSEDRPASFKGMGLFLMSGISVFMVSYFIFSSERSQKSFLDLCSFSFIILLLIGGYEFIQQISVPGERILLLSTNPIPAGSLLILLSLGPLVLLSRAKSVLEKRIWAFSLLAGALLVILIGQRGPVLALTVMAFLLLGTKPRRLLVLIAVILVLAGLGFQFNDKIPSKYKEQFLKKETLLVRLEFYHIALEVIREKPLFGLGFNSPLSRFTPYYYETKSYPRDQANTFLVMADGANAFDNMILSLLCETGGLFTMAYMGLGAYLLKNIIPAIKHNPNARVQAWFLLVVLAGFCTHSITFDSLKFPHLNWLFHSFLGLMAHCQGFDQERN